MTYHGLKNRCVVCILASISRKMSRVPKEKPGATRKLRAYERVRRKIPIQRGMHVVKDSECDEAMAQSGVWQLNTHYSSTRDNHSCVLLISECLLRLLPLSLPFDARGTTLRIILAVTLLPSL